MPYYFTKDFPRDQIEKKRRENVCKECGEFLAIFYDDDPQSEHHGQFYLACKDYRRTHHEGIEREASPIRQRGMEAMNIEARRNLMNEQYGEETTTKLAQFQGVTSLTTEDAMIILDSIWPKAPPEEKTRAAMLCKSYHLNPLMKHVYLIPFNRKDKTGRIIETTWATVMGIAATRLLASRSGSFSYIDDTPRVMTDEEQKRIFGKAYTNRLYVIVKGKDPKTGAEAVGYGWWPISPDAPDGKVYGEDKGNTAFNMATVRGERQMLGRLRPGEMPEDIEVMDDRMAHAGSINGVVIEGDSRVIETPEEIVEPEEAPPIDDSLPGTEPEPPAEAQPPAEKPKDESPISKDSVTKIMGLSKEVSWTMADLGKLMSTDLKWKVPAKLSELKQWQGDELLAILNRATGRA